MKNYDLFYRVSHFQTHQGLWYDANGGFTGLIHKEFDFCKNRNLQMPFDETMKGWLSATRTLEELFEWFTAKDVYRLQHFGYYASIFKSTNYKPHENHWLIDQKDAEFLERVEIYTMPKTLLKDSEKLTEKQA